MIPIARTLRPCVSKIAADSVTSSRTLMTVDVQRLSVARMLVCSCLSPGIGGCLTLCQIWSVVDFRSELGVLVLEDLWQVKAALMMKV